jgi:hypothetical protein
VALQGRKDLKVVVGTHHKTGSKFFSQSLKSLKRNSGLRIWLDTKQKKKPQPPDRWDCYFQNHCFWRIDLKTTPFRGIHSTRNPAALILSAVRYHLRTDEQWAHRQRPEFGGRTYAETLKSLPELDDRIIFEIDHVAGRTIRRMLEVYEDPRFLHVDLDRISRDETMADLRACFDFCGLERWCDLDTWLASCRPHCLWSMKTLPSHVTAAAREDRAALLASFGPRARDHFRSRFGDLLFNLVFG